MSVRRDGFVDGPVDEGLASLSSSRTSSNPSNMSSDVTSSTFVCDVCGRQFPSENSLKMHRVRTHGGPPRASNYVEIEPPDAIQSLLSLLRLFISEREARGLIEIIKNHGPDNLFKLNEGLTDLNVPINKRKMIIEAWAESRRIPIPPNLARELGINPTISMPYHFPEQSRDDMMIFDALLKWESLKREITPQIQQDNQIQQIVQTYENRVAELQKEIQTLKDTLNKKELENVQEKLKELSDKLEKVREEALTGKSELASVLNVLSKHVEGVADRIETLFMAKMGFIRADLVEKFQLPEKKVEEGASETLLNKVNPKWVTET